MSETSRRLPCGFLLVEVMAMIAVIAIILGPLAGAVYTVRKGVQAQAKSAVFKQEWAHCSQALRDDLRGATAVKWIPIPSSECDGAILVIMNPDKRFVEYHLQSDCLRREARLKTARGSKRLERRDFKLPLNGFTLTYATAAMHEAGKPEAVQAWRLPEAQPERPIEATASPTYFQLTVSITLPGKRKRIRELVVGATSRLEKD